MKTTYFGLLAALAFVANIAHAQDQDDTGAASEVSPDNAAEVVVESDDTGGSDESGEEDEEHGEVASERTALANTTEDGTEDDPAAQALEQLANLPDEIQSDGAFRYRVPIKIPSFRGLEPNLALVYNSSQKLYADEGPIAGVGWSMSGLSVIERVSVGGGIASFIDGEDVYRIDGQELLACADADASSAYDPSLVGGSAVYPARFETTNYSASCAAGGQFVTLMDDGRRVEIVQDSDEGVTFPKFIVTGQDGTQRVYESIGKLIGITLSQDIARLANHGLRTKFLLTEVRDAQSDANIVTYEYDFDTENNVEGYDVPAVTCSTLYPDNLERIRCSIRAAMGNDETREAYRVFSKFGITDRLSKITYGGYEVTFRYVAQTLPLRTFGTGHIDLLGENKSLLTSVEVRDGESGIRAYGFDYEDSPAFGRKRLITAAEYGDDYTVTEALVVSGTSLPPATFAYTDDAVSFTSQSYGFSETGLNTLIADFDGNGSSDITYQSAGSAAQAPVQRATFHFERNASDETRDLRTTVNGVTLPVSYVVVREDDPDYRVNWISHIDVGSPDRGMSRQLFGSKWINRTSGSNSWQTHYIYDENAVPGTGLRLQKHSNPLALIPLNMDRDPENEYIVKALQTEGPASIAYESGQQEYVPAGFDVSSLIYRVGSDVKRFSVVGDFDGNGLSDVATRNGTVFAYENGYQRRPNGIPEANDTRTRAHAADMNGDGLDDVVYFDTGENQDCSLFTCDDSDPYEIVVFYSHGSGFLPGQRILYGDNSSAPSVPDGMPSRGWGPVQHIVDVNGDGLADIIFRKNNNKVADPVESISGDARILLWDGAGFSIAQDENGTFKTFSDINGFSDFDGDGLVDLFSRQNGNVAHWNTGSIPHLLTSVRTPLGATVAVDYAPSSDGPVVQDDQIVGIRQVVASVTLSDDHWNEPRVTRYRYRGGRYDYVWQRSLGFGQVDMILPSIDDNREDVVRTAYNNDDFRTAGTVRFVQRGVYAQRALECPRPDPSTGEIPDCTELREAWLRSLAENATHLTTNDWAPVGVVPVHTPDDGFASLAAYVSNHVTGGHDLASGGPYRAELLSTHTRTSYGVTSYGAAYVENGMAYEYDGLGRRVAEIDLGMANVRFDLDAAGNVSTVLTYADMNDAFILNAVTSKSVINGNGLADDIATNRLQRELYFYDGATAFAGQQPATGNRTAVQRLERNAAGVDSYVTAETTTYDNYGNALSMTDARGATSTFAYDPVKHLFQTSATNALSQSSTTTWDTGCQQPLTATDANGQTTTLTYDVFCRRTRETNALGGYISTDYLDLGSQYQAIRTTRSSGIVPQDQNAAVSYEYIDGLGRIHLTAANGGGDATATIYQKTEYDARGRVLRSSIPVDDTTPASLATAFPAEFTAFTYDVLDRPIGTTHPDGSTDRTTYRTRDLPLSAGQQGASDVITAKYAVTEYEDAHCFDDDASTLCSPVQVVQDHKGNRIQSILTDPGTDVGSTAGERVTAYQYDALNRLVGVTDPAGAEWAYSYDTLGRRLTSDDPDLGFWTMDYDANGNLTEQTDAKGQLISFSYDALNRVTNKSTATESIDYAYDEPRAGVFNVGQLTTVENAEHRIEHDYNALGLLTSQRHWVDDLTALAPDFTFETSYLLNGDVESTSMPLTVGAANTVLGPYVYDNAARVIGFDSYLSNVTYDVWGNPTRMDYGNGAYETRTYDAQRGWLDEIFVNYVDGTRSANRYFRSATGRVHQNRGFHGAGVFDYDYDYAGRLIESDNVYVNSVGNQPYAVYSQTFSYDAAGNMRSNSHVGSYDYPLASANRPHAPTMVNGQALTYDANGNMLTGLHGKTMTYDNENRPLSVTHNGVTTEYVYGADGARLKVIAEVGTANEAETLYVGPIEVRNFGQTSASLVAYPHPNVRLVDGVESYLHRDQLNSVSIITGATGAHAREEAFLPFGKISATRINDPAVADDAKGFIGERYDSDAGLQYLNARYYDPELSLFLQPDWFEVTDPGVGTNRYSYSFNDPVNLSDPLGNKLLGDSLRELGERAVRAATKAARDRGVADAWKMERQMVRETGQGTVDWSTSQVDELLETGKVQGYIGDHINTVNGNLAQAADHRNIQFLTEAAHIERHAAAGGTRVPISGGPIIDRTMGGELADLATPGARAWPGRVLGVVGAGLGSVADVMDAVDPLEMGVKNSGLGYVDSWEMMRFPPWTPEGHYIMNCRGTPERCS